MKEKAGAAKMLNWQASSSTQVTESGSVAKPVTLLITRQSELKNMLPNFQEIFNNYRVLESKMKY
jgi:hypothetical protein